jgi:tetratricopeptide (TPR) repeat protein
MFNWKKKKVQGPGSEGQSSAQAAKAQGDEDLKAGRLEAAEANYRLALEEDAGLGSALVNLGFVLQQMNRLEEARTVLERASEVAPDDADGHYLLAGVLQSAGENAAAIGHLEQALELREEFDLAYRDLIVLLFGQGQIAQATQWCERGLLACPGSAELHFYRSNLFKQAGDREAAIASCQKALELNAALLGARLSLSGLLLESGRLEEALASYRVEIEWNPNHALRRSDPAVPARDRTLPRSGGLVLLPGGGLLDDRSCGRGSPALGPKDVRGGYRTGSRDCRIPLWSRQGLSAACDARGGALKL